LIDRFVPLQAASSADRPLPPLPARPSAEGSSLQLLSDVHSADSGSSGMAGVVSGGTTSSHDTDNGSVQQHSIEGVQSPTSNEAKNATKREKVRTLVVSHSLC
jgi:hypothetical protein